MPTHAVFESGDFRQGGAGNRGVGDVAGIKMGERTVHVIADERATWAALFPAGAQHEVIDDELGFVAEKIGKRYFSLGPVEGVVLFDLDPGQFATLGADGIALAGERLFGGEEFFASSEPFLPRNHFVFW